MGRYSLGGECIPSQGIPEEAQCHCEECRFLRFLTHRHWCSPILLCVEVVCLLQTVLFNLLKSAAFLFFKLGKMGPISGARYGSIVLLFELRVAGRV